MAWGDVGEARKRWAARQQRTLPEPKEKPFSSGALTVGAAVVEVATSAQRMAARDIEGFGVVVSVQGSRMWSSGQPSRVFSFSFSYESRGACPDLRAHYSSNGGTCLSVGPFETIHGGVSGRAAPSVVRAQRGVSAFAAAPFRHSDTPCCPENARAAAALNNRRAGETGGRCVLGTSWASPQRMRGDTCCCREQLRRCARLRSSQRDSTNTNTNTTAAVAVMIDAFLGSIINTSIC